MIEHLPDILRAAVSTTMNVVLMLTLLQPKYGKKVTRLAMLGILVLDFGTALYCYLWGDLTLLSRIDLILFAVVCFAVRPLFRDTFMQWLFSYITVQNISDIVIILSFILSRRLPYPAYANSIIRLVLFLAFYVVLKYWVRPLYRKVVEHWNVFFYVTFAIYLAFGYYSVFTDDIVATLTEQRIPLLLLIAVVLTSYGSIVYSMKILSQEAALQEENLKIQSDRELTRQRLALMDETVRQMSIAQHDRRHFNNTLLSLLQQGETDKAADFVQQQSAALPQKPQSYCRNVSVNAAVSYYAQLAHQQGIRCELRLDIPEKLSVDELSLAMVISNLMENAMNAVSLLPAEKRELHFTAVYTGQLILELTNPYEGVVTLDENGLPVPQEKGHGKGSQSVYDFMKKCGGELVYETENGIFKVRIMV
ncbi:MAG: GHKL domain-containing protein [Lachnospiraceae bacterium]|nr:GHKL domain-containing protein [Lachnospiraceae bacterium]